MRKFVLFMVTLAIVSWSMASQADVHLITYLCGFYSTVNGECHITNSKVGEKKWIISKDAEIFLDGKKSSLADLEGKSLVVEIYFMVAPRENAKDRYEAIVMKATAVSKEDAEAGIVVKTINLELEPNIEK